MGFLPACLRSALFSGDTVVFVSVVHLYLGQLHSYLFICRSVQNHIRPSSVSQIRSPLKMTAHLGARMVKVCFILQHFEPLKLSLHTFVQCVCSHLKSHQESIQFLIRLSKSLSDMVLTCTQDLLIIWQIAHKATA